jgi:cyclophilin family peptidyl-prolyl cis-trans isomerase
VLAQLLELHPDDLQLSFRHFPLMPIHDKASLAGQAAEAAGAQGAFWPMHDTLFDRFQEWTSLEPAQFMEWLIETAGDLELDTAEFEDDLRSGRYAQQMDEAYNEAFRVGVPGTPFILINGQPILIEPSLLNLEQSVRLHLLETQHYDEYPPMLLEQGVEYYVHLHLSIGDLSIRLLPESAPLAVNSFLFLAGEGWFDGNDIYRVISGQYVESGDPSGLGYGDAGYHFKTEIDPSLSFASSGMVAMSSTGPDTNGSRFFITLGPFPQLDGSRTIFGQVIEGLDLLRSLQPRDPIEDLFIPPETVIQSIEVEKR